MHMDEEAGLLYRLVPLLHSWPEEYEEVAMEHICWVLDAVEAVGGEADRQRRLDALRAVTVAAEAFHEDARREEDWRQRWKRSPSTAGPQRFLEDGGRERALRAALAPYLPRQD